MQIDKSTVINIEDNPDYALMIAAELFHSGKVFIYPTDTIYGIGGNPFDETVVRRISEIKGRDEKKHFIWLLSDFENVMNYADIIFENHVEFLTKIWPAPVTVVLNLNERTKEIANMETVAFRVPQNDFCQNLLKEISRPLISTSVNRSNDNPLNNVDEIINNFSQEVDGIFYHNQPTSIKSSTIIDLTTKQARLIREGSITFVELLKKLS